MQPLYGISRHQRVGLSSDRLFIGQNHLICTFLFPDTMEMTSTKASSRAGSKWHREQNLKHANKHSGSSLSLSANCYAFKKTRGLHHQTLLESWCQESLCKTGHHFFLQENKHCVVCETGERMWVTHTHTLYINTFNLTMFTAACVHLTARQISRNKKVQICWFSSTLQDKDRTIQEDIFLTEEYKRMIYYTFIQC